MSVAEVLSPSKEIATIEPAHVLTVVTESGAVDPILERIRREIDEFAPDISTAKGSKEIASMAYRVAQSKTYLEGVGKRLADEQKEIPKKIDATRKRIRDTLDKWRDEVRAPLTEWENAEDERIECHEANKRARTKQRSAPEDCWSSSGIEPLMKSRAPYAANMCRPAMGWGAQQRKTAVRGEAAAARDAT